MAASALAATLGATGGILGGANGTYGSSSGIGGGIGISGSQSHNISYGSGSSSGYGYSNSTAGSQGSNWGNSWSNSVSRVYGSEASAKDLERTAEANLLQQDLFNQHMNFNKAEAAENRAFQEYMSNTAYQRAVVDLIKAGLNPILAVGNMGATTPIGSMASSALASSHKAQTFADQYSYSNSGSSWGGNNSSWENSNSYNQNSSRNSSYSSGASTSKSFEANFFKNQSQTSNNIRDITKTAIGALGKYLKNPPATPTH